MPEARILIVEDEGIEAMDIQQRLQVLGYSASEIAFDGEEAIRLANQIHPDLVLMDIMLPGEIDGVMAAEAIRSRLDIPIVYLTAYADEATLQRAKITEPYGYIVKPFKERELHVTIDVALYKHRTERKLRESEKWLATTLKSIGDGVIATDSQGRITFMNPVAEGLMGWKLSEVRHRILTEVFTIVNKDSRQPVENPVTRVLLEGKIVGLANHTVLIARDGREISINDSAAPIKDERGKVLGVVLVFSNITELERAGEALLQAKKEWELTFDAVPDLIAILDRHHQIIRVNKAMADRLGVTPAQCVGLRCHEAVHGLSEPPGFCPHSQTCRDGLEHITEVHEPRLGGDFLVSTTPLIGLQGDFIGTVHVARDITARKQAEDDIKQLNEILGERAAELEVANRELEAFTYSVSHDLKAPLRGIAGFIQILKEDYGDRLDGQGLDYLRRVLEKADKMSKLIEALLSLSRVSRQEVARAEVNISAKAAGIVENLRQTHPGREVTVSIRDDLKVLADPSLIEIVLANLLGNAWKFTSKTTNSHIELGATPGEKDKGGDRRRTVYYVRDNGAGFDQAYKKNLFSPFGRLHSDQEFEGMGIGLSIVERIIHRHGGRVWAEGERQKGATIYFTLN